MGDIESINTIEEFGLFEQTKKEHKRVWTFRLFDDFSIKTELTGHIFRSNWVSIDKDGTIKVKKGYAWDGCTPKCSILDLAIIGTPDGRKDTAIDSFYNMPTDKGYLKPKTYYASLVHDALYQYYAWHDISRKQIDLLFLEMLRHRRFLWAQFYYFAVRLIGGWYAGRKSKLRGLYKLKTVR